jgi:hypothetical protein
MFHWHQTSPDSPFTNHTVFTLARPWGRSTVTERYRMETAGPAPCGTVTGARASGWRSFAPASG